MNTVSRAHSSLRVIRWIARIGGLLFVVATAGIDAIVIAETVGGNGPNWANLSANQWVTVALAFGLPFVSIVGIVIAWLRPGIGEGIGGALIVAAALVAMVSSFIDPLGGGASMAAAAMPMTLVGVCFLYCWWDTQHALPQPAA